MYWFEGMVDVFISYAREDREPAAKLAQALEVQGYSVWWDPDIPPGKKWADVIGTQLGAARCVVALWSTVSVQKRWVRKEASFADARNKLIPAKLEDVTISFEFADVQAADLTGWQGESGHKGFRHLVSAISEQLRKPPAEHPEEDIVVATEQAKAQLAEIQAPPRPASTDAKIEKPSLKAVRERSRAHVRMPDAEMLRRTLLSKKAIIIGGVSVVLVASLLSILAPQEPSEEAQRHATTAPGVTTVAPESNGASDGTGDLRQPGQAVDSPRSITGTEPGSAPAMTTGTTVVRAEEKGAIFSVYDGDGRSLTSARVNDPISLFPGNYRVKINGSENQISIKAGQKAALETGSIVVRAEEKGARFFVYDGDGRYLTNASVNDPISLFPGTYKLKFQGSERIISVQAGQRAF